MAGNSNYGWWIAGAIIVALFLFGGGSDLFFKNKIDSFSCLKNEVVKITPISDSSRAPNLEYRNDDTKIGIVISPLPQTQDGVTMSSCSQVISQNSDESNIQLIQNIDGMKIYDTPMSYTIFFCGEKDNVLLTEYSFVKQLTQDDINSIVY